MDTTESNERDAASAGGEHRPTFRQTLLRVMIVQVVALALLWLLQATYCG